MTLSLRYLAVGPLQSNCYLLQDNETDQAILIDPGDQADKILPWVGAAHVELILITHGDHDHVGALKAVKAAHPAPVWMHPQAAERAGIQPDVLTDHGDAVDFLNYRLNVAHVPGHTPGSIIFHLPEGGSAPLAFVGDAIFPGGPGHTPSHAALLSSLEALSRTVFTWPDETLLYPGHGLHTSVGAERAQFEAFVSGPLANDLYGDITWNV